MKISRLPLQIRRFSPSAVHSAFPKSKAICRSSASQQDESGHNIQEFYGKMEMRLHDLYPGTHGVGNILERVWNERSPLVYKYHAIFRFVERLRNRNVHVNVNWQLSPEKFAEFKNAVLDISKPRSISDVAYATPKPLNYQSTLTEARPLFDQHLSIPFRNADGVLSLLTMRTVLQYLYSQHGKCVNLNDVTLKEVFALNRETWETFGEKDKLSHVRAAFSKKKTAKFNLWPGIVTTDGRPNGEFKGLFGFWDVVYFTPPYSTFKMQSVRENSGSPRSQVENLLPLYSQIQRGLKRLLGEEALSKAKDKLAIVRDQYEFLKSVEYIVTGMDSVGDSKGYVVLPPNEELILLERIVQSVEAAERIEDAHFSAAWRDCKEYPVNSPLSHVINVFDRSFIAVVRREKENLALLTMRSVLRALFKAADSGPINLTEMRISEAFNLRDHDEWFFLDPSEPIDVARMRFEESRAKNKAPYWGCLLTAGAKANVPNLYGLISSWELAEFEMKAIWVNSERVDTIQLD